MDPATLAAMGGELRARRRARGVTRAALAQALGTRPVNIGRWERGEAVPGPGQARALAAALDLPPEPAAAWLAASELVGADPGRGWRLPGRDAVVIPVALGPGPSPGAATEPPPASYLDEPAERRRYTLRWALTLVILGVLAIALIWALGELGDGWRAVVDLFRDGPPAEELPGAWDLGALL